MNHYKHKRQGFTMIELMLSMTFISMLLLVIMMTVLHMTKIYEKGISMREVNQAGRSIAADLTRSIGSATPFDTADASYFRSTTGAGGKHVGGRLCTGQVSYIWNISKHTVNGGGVRLVKIYDPERHYCINSGASVVGASNATDLLKDGERDLVLHNFTISRSSDGIDLGAGQALYSVRFVVGTGNVDVLESNNASCKPPRDAKGEEDYCAVNRFDIVIRAGNKELLNGDNI